MDRITFVVFYFHCDGHREKNSMMDFIITDCFDDDKREVAFVVGRNLWYFPHCCEEIHSLPFSRGALNK